MTKSDQRSLLDWYFENRRDLPWRKNRDPYRVWISETMLQQTTTTAVLGFYDRFLKRFPDLKSLADAPLTDVYSLWAGLGYYSRARNLHKAAQLLHAKGTFPQTHKELLDYPGFGPYTSRAVSSIAFSEAVGVLDGNVIRVWSRKENLKSQWWKTKERQQLQQLVDQFVAEGPSHNINQALMELGSQICTPKSPHCVQCPWLKTCKARRAKTISLRPLKKIRRPSENWVWTAQVVCNRKGDSVLLAKNNYAPFLRESWFLPGSIRKVKVRPQRYDFRHSITHHDIFVQVQAKHASIKKQNNDNSNERWVHPEKLSQWTPASLVRKAVQHGFRIKNKTAHKIK